MKKFVILDLFLLGSFSLSAHNLSQQDRMTIISFEKEDYGEELIPRDIGWRLGCLLSTPSFHIPHKTDMELQILVKLSGKWSDFVQNIEETLDIELARLDLRYTGELQTKKRISKFLLPEDLGPVKWLMQSSEGTHLFGNSEQNKQLVFGPISVEAGSRDLTINLCRIAPRTTLHIYSIEVRIMPAS